MALRVAGDPDLVEAVAQRAHRGEEVDRAVELARLRGVPRRHEQLADAGAEQPLGDLLQVRGVAHEPGGEVGHDRVAGAREPLAQPERRLQALARRGGHGDLRPGREMREHLVLDAVERQHLEARVTEQSGERGGAHVH